MKETLYGVCGCSSVKTQGFKVSSSFSSCVYSASSPRFLRVADGDFLNHPSNSTVQAHDSHRGTVKCSHVKSDRSLASKPRQMATKRRFVQENACR